MRISFLLSSCSICLSLLVSDVYSHTGLRKSGFTTYHSRFSDSLSDSHDDEYRNALFSGYDEEKAKKYKRMLSGWTKKSAVDGNISLKVMKCYDGSEQQILEAMQYTDRALDVCTWNNWDIFNLIKNYHDEFRPKDNGKFSLRQINTIAYASFGYSLYSELDKLCVPGTNNTDLEKKKNEILKAYYENGKIAGIIKNQFTTAFNDMPEYIKSLFGNITGNNALNEATLAEIAQGVEAFVHLTRGVHNIIGEFDYQNELAINSRMLDIKNLSDLFGLNECKRAEYTDSQIINLSNDNLMKQLNGVLKKEVYENINANLAALSERDKDGFAEAVSDVIVIPDGEGTGWNDEEQREELKARLFSLYETNAGKDLLKNILALGWLARLMDGKEIKNLKSGKVFSVNLDADGINAITVVGRYLDKITFKPIVLRYKGSDDANFEMPGYAKVPNHIIEVSKLEQDKPDALLHELNHYFISIIFHNIDENDQINSTALKYDKSFSEYAYGYNNKEYVDAVAGEILKTVEFPNNSGQLSSMIVTPLSDEEKGASLGGDVKKDEKKDLGKTSKQDEKVQLSAAIEYVKNDWQLKRLLTKNGLLYRSDVQDILGTSESLDVKKQKLLKLSIYSDRVRKDIINSLYAEYKTENYENRVADEICKEIEEIYQNKTPTNEDLVKMCVVIRLFDRRCNPFSNANEMLTIIGAVPYWFGNKKFLIVNPNSEHDYLREKFSAEKLRFKHCTDELLFSLLYAGALGSEVDEGPAQFVKLGVPNEVAKGISDCFKDKIKSTPAENGKDTLTFVAKDEIGKGLTFSSELPYAWTSTSYFYGGHVGAIIGKAKNIIERYDPDNPAEADIGVFLIQNLEQNSIYTQKLVSNMIGKLHENLKNNVSVNAKDKENYNSLRANLKKAQGKGDVEKAQKELNAFLTRYKTGENSIKDLRKYLIFDRLYEWLVAYSFDFMKNETILDVLGNQRDIPLFDFSMGMALHNMKDGYDGNYIRWFIKNIFEKVKWTGVFLEEYGQQAAELYKIADKEKIEVQDLFKLCNVLCGAYKFPEKIRNNIEVLAALTWASICPDYFHKTDGIEYVLKLYKEDRDKGLSSENCRGLNPDMFVAVCMAFPGLASDLDISLHSVFDAYHNEENQQKYFKDISVKNNDIMRYVKNKSADALIHKCLYDTCSISVVDSNLYAGLLLSNAYVNDVDANALSTTEKRLLMSYIDSDKNGDVFGKEVWDEILLYLYIFSKDNKDGSFQRIKREWCQNKELYDYLSRSKERNIITLISDISENEEQLGVNDLIGGFFCEILIRTLYEKEKKSLDGIWSDTFKNIQNAKRSNVIKLCRNRDIYEKVLLMFDLYCFYKNSVSADDPFVKWFRGEEVQIDGVTYKENDVYLNATHYLLQVKNGDIPDKLPYTCMLLSDYNETNVFDSYLVRVAKLLGAVSAWSDIKEFAQKVQHAHFLDFLKKYCIWNANNSEENFDNIQKSISALLKEGTVSHKDIWLLLNVFGEQFSRISTGAYNSNDKLRTVLLYTLCNAATSCDKLNILNDELPIIKHAPETCRTLNQPLKELIVKDLSFESVVALFCAGIRWDYHTYEYFHCHDGVSKVHNYSDGRNYDNEAFKASLYRLIKYVEAGSEAEKKRKRIEASKLFWSPYFELQAATLTAVMTLWGANCEVKSNDVNGVLNNSKRPEDLIRDCNGNLFAKTNGGKLAFPLFIDMLEHNNINLQTAAVSQKNIQLIEEFKQYKGDAIKLSMAIKDFSVEQMEGVDTAIREITNSVIDKKITEFMQVNKTIVDNLVKRLSLQEQTGYHTINAILRNFICNDPTAILGLLKLATKEKTKFEMLLNAYVQAYLDSLGNDAIIVEIRNNYNSEGLSDNLKNEIKILQQKRIVTNYVEAKVAILGQDDADALGDETVFLNKLKDKVCSHKISMDDLRLDAKIYWDVNGKCICMEAFNNLGDRNILLSIRDILLIVHHNEIPVSMTDITHLFGLSKRNSRALNADIIWIKHITELMKETAQVEEISILDEIVDYFTRDNLIDYTKHAHLDVTNKTSLDKLKEEFNEDDANFIISATKMSKSLSEIKDFEQAAEKRSSNWSKINGLVSDENELKMAISAAHGNTPWTLKDWENAPEFKADIANVKSEYKKAKAILEDGVVLRTAISAVKGDTPENLKNWENAPEFRDNIANAKAEYKKAKRLVGDENELRMAISAVKGDIPENLKNWEDFQEFKDDIANAKAEYKKAKAILEDDVVLRTAISAVQGDTPENLKNWENVPEFKANIANAKAEYKKAKAILEDGVVLRTAIFAAQGNTPENLKNWENAPGFRDNIANAKAEYKEIKVLVDDENELKKAIAAAHGDTPENLKNWEDFQGFKDDIAKAKAEYKKAKTGFSEMLSKRSLFEFVKYMIENAGCVMPKRFIDDGLHRYSGILEVLVQDSISALKKFETVDSENEIERFVLDFLRCNDSEGNLRGILDLEKTVLFLIMAKDNQKINLLKKILATKQYNYDSVNWHIITDLPLQFDDFADCLQEIILINNIGLDYEKYGFKKRKMTEQDLSSCHVQNLILRNIVRQAVEYVFGGDLYYPDNTIKRKKPLTPAQKRIMKLEQIEKLPIGKLRFSRRSHYQWDQVFDFHGAGIYNGDHYIMTNISIEILCGLLGKDFKKIPVEKQIAIVNDMPEGDDGETKFKTNVSSSVIDSSVKRLAKRIVAEVFGNVENFNEANVAILDNRRNLTLPYRYSSYSVANISIEKILILKIAESIVEYFSGPGEDPLNSMRENGCPKLLSLFGKDVVESCLAYVNNTDVEEVIEAWQYLYSK